MPCPWTPPVTTHHPQNPPPTTHRPHERTLPSPYQRQQKKNVEKNAAAFIA